MSEIDELLTRIRAFASDRDWQQFHSPKNISTALSVEASELLEHLQWMAEVESRDLIQAENLKIDKSAIKYPMEKSKGRST